MGIVKFIKKLFNIRNKLDYVVLVKALRDLYIDVDRYSPRDLLSIYSNIFEWIFKKGKIRTKEMSCTDPESLNKDFHPILSILWIRKVEERLSEISSELFLEYYSVWSEIKICIMRFSFIKLYDWPMSAESILEIVIFKAGLPKPKIEEIYENLIEMTDKILNE